MVICLSICISNLMRSLGEAGEIEPETESFLLDNEVDYSEFSKDVLDCLPKDLPWSIPEVCSIVQSMHNCTCTTLYM